MDISDFKLITILAKEGNITRTAESLYTTQSAISYRIKSIEKELGATLFERSKKGIALTSAGQIALEFAERFVEEYGELQTSLGYSVNSEIVGNVRVGTTTSMMRHVMMKIIHQLRLTYPNITITMSAGKSDQIAEQTRDGQLDMSIARGDIKWSGEKILLFEEPVCIVTKGPFTSEVLENELFFTHPTSNAMDIIERFFKENKKAARHFSAVEDIESSLDMVEQGLGWTIVPAISLPGRKALSCYQMVWPDGELATRKTWYLVNDKIDLEEPRFNVFDEFSRNKIPALMNKMIKQLDIMQIRTDDIFLF